MGTSLTDLTAALGINKPSLYATFGNKEQLFSQSLDHYLSHYRGPTLTVLTHPPEAPLAERMQRYLYAVIDVVANPETPQGCMFVNSCCEAGGTAIPPALNDSLCEASQEFETVLAGILKTEQKNGCLTEGVDVSQLAGYLASVMVGLCVQARNGKPKQALRSVADMFIEQQASYQ